MRMFVHLKIPEIILSLVFFHKKLGWTRIFGIDCIFYESQKGTILPQKGTILSLPLDFSELKCLFHSRW